MKFFDYKFSKLMLLIAASFLLFAPVINAEAVPGMQEPQAPQEMEVTLLADVLRSVEGVTGDLVGDRDVLITWEPALDNRVEQYILYRGSSPDALEELAVFGITERSYVDEGLQEGSQYYYRVDSAAIDFEPTAGPILEISLTRETPQLGEAAETSSTPVANLDNQPLGFWGGLVLFNVLTIGALVIAYILLKKFLYSRSRVDFRPKPKLDAKMGKRDVNISFVAKKRYMKKQKDKLDEWDKAAD